MNGHLGQPAVPLAAAAARAPGTCGELVQGALGGRHFHVTCPIDMHSTATATLLPGSGRVVGPGDCPKAVAGARLALARSQRRDVDVHLVLDSPLPRGKGMASSTADVAAAIAATAAALGARLGPWEIASMALQVEPSDGVMFPGIVAFDHREGAVYEPLGAAPGMGVLVLDLGGTVDTLAFNAVDRAPLLAAVEPELRLSLALVRAGLLRREARLIGQGATLDTLSHRGLASERHRDAVIDLGREAGALGVNTAHSGTVFGLLLPDDEGAMERALALARARIPALEAAYRCRLADGGIQYVAPAAAPRPVAAHAGERG